MSAPGREGYRAVLTPPSIDEYRQERATGLTDTLGATGVITNPVMLATPHIATEVQGDDSLLVAQYDANGLELHRAAHALLVSTHGVIVPSECRI